MAVPSRGADNKVGKCQIEGQSREEESRGVGDVEMDMSPSEPGGKCLRSFICSARSSVSRSENFAAHKHAGTVVIVHYL